MLDPENSCQSTYKEIEIGPANSFKNLPCSVAIANEDYFLTQDDAGRHYLLSTVCPHMWGAIAIEDNCFICPDHGWKFNLTEGICINGPRSQMYSINVVNKRGLLFAQFPYR